MDTCLRCRPARHDVAPSDDLTEKPRHCARGLLISEGDWTCSVARFTGTMTGPMKGPDGNDIAPTGKSFEVDFCTVAQWDNGQIVEENLFYDLVSFMRQIGLGG